MEWLENDCSRFPMKNQLLFHTLLSSIWSVTVTFIDHSVMCSNRYGHLIELGRLFSNARVERRETIDILYHRMRRLLMVLYSLLIQSIWPCFGSEGRNGDAARVAMIAIVKAFNSVMRKLPGKHRGQCQLELIPIQVSRGGNGI